MNTHRMNLRGFLYAGKAERREYPLICKGFENDDGVQKKAAKTPSVVTQMRACPTYMLIDACWRYIGKPHSIGTHQKTGGPVKGDLWQQQVKAAQVKKKH